VAQTRARNRAAPRDARSAARAGAWNRAAPPDSRVVRRAPAPGIALRRAICAQHGANRHPKSRHTARRVANPFPKPRRNAR